MRRTDHRNRAFTLLELLAAVTLLVVLGTLLFQIFNQASHVMRIGTGRQEVFQYARAVLLSLERELIGAIAQRDASRNAAINSSQSRPFRLYHSDSALGAFGMPVRPGTDALSFTAGVIGRDTVQNSKTYGQTAMDAHLAYWVSSDDCATNRWVLNRYESYDIATSTQGRGWELALNVLEFHVDCLDQFLSPPQWRTMDWESTGVDTPTGERRGLPRAVAVTLRLTDQNHIGLYEFYAPNRASRLKEGYTPDDDPMVREFRQVIQLREE